MAWEDCNAASMDGSYDRRVLKTVHHNPWGRTRTNGRSPDVITVNQASLAKGLIDGYDRETTGGGSDRPSGGSRPSGRGTR